MREVGEVEADLVRLGGERSWRAVFRWAVASLVILSDFLRPGLGVSCLHNPNSSPRVFLRLDIIVKALSRAVLRVVETFNAGSDRRAPVL